MKKLVLGVDEKDYVIKQIKSIRNLQQLKIYDLRLFDEYANYFYKYWSEIGRPFDEDLLLKFVDKLLGRIGEKLHNELINWFKTKRTQRINYYAILLPVTKYVRGRIKEYCEEEKYRHQLKLQFRKMCIDMTEVPTLDCNYPSYFIRNIENIRNDMVKISNLIGITVEKKFYKKKP